MASDGSVDLGQTARRLIRQGVSASLATAGRPASPGDGFPFASLVLVAADHDGAPLLLISSLAEHTRNIAADARVSLLFDGTAGLADPLEGARLTVLGQAEAAPASHQRARFRARHPAAAVYADFKDFALVRIAPRRAHLVAGFGRIAWLDANQFLLDGGKIAALIEAEPTILAHMNNDHAATLTLYAQRLLARPEAGWRLSGIDPDGLDLTVEGVRARLDFDQPIRSPAEAHTTLAALAARARAAPDAGSG